MIVCARFPRGFAKRFDSTGDSARGAPMDRLFAQDGVGEACPTACPLLACVGMNTREQNVVDKPSV